MEYDVLNFGETKFKSRRTDIVYHFGENLAVGLGNAVEKINCALVSRSRYPFKALRPVRLVVYVPVTVCKAPDKRFVSAALYLSQRFSEYSPQGGRKYFIS